MPKLEGLGMWLGCDCDAGGSVSHLSKGSEHEMIAISPVSYHEVSRIGTRNHFIFHPAIQWYKLCIL